MKTFYNISLLTIIPIISIILIFQARKISKLNNEILKCVSLYEASKEVSLETFRQFGRMINVIHLSTSEKLERGHIISNNENEEIDLLDVINSPKLIFKFSERHCHSCVQEILDWLQELAQTIGSRNIILIAERISSENLSWLRNEVTQDMGLYYCSYKSQFIRIIEDNDLPYLFTLNKNGIVGFPMPITDQIDLLNDSYYNNLISFFNH